MPQFFTIYMIDAYYLNKKIYAQPQADITSFTHPLRAIVCLDALAMLDSYARPRCDIGDLTQFRDGEPTGIQR